MTEKLARWMRTSESQSADQQTSFDSYVHDNWANYANERWIIFLRILRIAKKNANKNTTTMTTTKMMTATMFDFVWAERIVANDLTLSGSCFSQTQTMVAKVVYVNPQMPKVKIHLRTPKGGGGYHPLDFCLPVRIFCKYFSWVCFRGQGIQRW